MEVTPPPLPPSGPPPLALPGSIPAAALPTLPAVGALQRPRLPGLCPGSEACLLRPNMLVHLHIRLCLPITHAHALSPGQPIISPLSPKVPDRDKGSVNVCLTHTNSRASLSGPAQNGEFP